MAVDIALVAGREALIKLGPVVAPELDIEGKVDVHAGDRFHRSGFAGVMGECALRLFLSQQNHC